MDNNRFFRWIWRFNALALALVLTIGAFALVNLLTPNSPYRSANDDSPLPPPRAELELTLLNAPAAPGFKIFRYGEKSAHGGSSLSSPPFDRILNYLFYNAKDGTSHWLLPSNNQALSTPAFIWDDGSTTGNDDTTRYSYQQPGAGRLVRVIIFTSLPLDGKPRRAELYASHPDGTGLTKLIADADYAPRFTTIDKDTIVIASERGGRAYATTVALTDFKQLRETNLSDPIPK
jgi:hypothetical protein